MTSRMDSMQGFQTALNFLVMPLFFLSGALYPLKGMPAWLQVLMQVDPLTYGIDALRHLMYGSSLLGRLMTQFALGQDLWVTVSVTVLLLVVASWMFNRIQAGLPGCGARYGPDEQSGTGQGL